MERPKKVDLPKEFVMQSVNERRRSAPAVVMVILGATLIGAALTGCGGGLAERDVLSKLEAAGLTVERLDESLLTGKQRQRIENPMETVFSAKVSDAAGNSQKMTIIGFRKDFMATSAGYEGVPGFAIRNWFFAGIPNAQIQAQIEVALR
jgi:hypothetical protein